MKSYLTKSLTKYDIVLLGLFTILSAWVYRGFYFPGGYMLSYGNIPTIILWFMRILLPLLYVGIIILSINFRLDKIRKSELALLCFSTLLGLYVCYSIGDDFYQRWFDNHRQEYHPYLQLVPTFDKRLDDTTSHPIKIFCLGGSTTEFPDHAGRDWPSRVEAILRTKPGLGNVEVYNCGRRWYTSLHSLINYETNLRKYKPSVIVIMQSINDLLENADFSYFSHGTFREDYGHFYGAVNRIIDRRSLWRYLRDVFSGIWYADSQRAITTNSFPGLKAYTRNIRTIIELAKHDSTQVILMTEPFIIKRNMTNEELAAIGTLRVEAMNDTMAWSNETIVNGMEQYNNAMKSIAQENNLPLIDLDNEVPKSLLYFRDEVHYQDTTFSLISPFIAARLFECLSSEGIRNN